MAETGSPFHRGEQAIQERLGVPWNPALHEVDSAIEGELGQELKMRMAEATAQIHRELTDLVAETEITMVQMEDLREDLVRLRPHEAPDSKAPPKPKAPSQKAGDVPVIREAQWQVIKDELLNHKFVWRSIERLARAADIEPQLAEDILKEHRDVVRISRGKSGRTIARHLSRQPR